MSSCNEIGQEKSDFWTNEMPRLVNLLRRARIGESESGMQKIKTLRQIAECLDPSYDTFYCPLTKKIMEHPVTIANGGTYERRAIATWFESNGIICPITRKELGTMEMSANVALSTTISEWRKKNDELRIKLACIALTIGSSNSMVFEAMRDLQRLCKRRACNLDLAHELGVMRLLGQLLDYEGSKMRCEALKALTFFAGDEEGKERIVNTRRIEMAVRLLSSDDPLEQDAAASFLLELSKSVAICRRIGLVSGAILMLITLKFNRSCVDSLTEKVNMTLENLEKCPKNIEFMAEDGYLKPLLKNLVEGSEEIQLDMANILGKITIPHHSKEHADDRATFTLLNMAQHPDPGTQLAALNALVQLSSHPSNATALVQLGAVHMMIESMFMGSTLIMPSGTSMHHHSTILANILDNLGNEPELLKIDSQGHTMTSHYTIYNLTNMLTLTSPHALNLNVLRILLYLMDSKSKKPADRIAKVIRDTETISAVIEFTRSDHEPLVIATLKLLVKLTPHMGTAIAERLCKANGQPDALLAGLQSDRVTEKHVVSAEFLAKLPRDNLSLNRALLRCGAVPVVLSYIDELHSNGRAVVNRNARLFLEGLVGILVRLTATTSDADILSMLVEKDVGTALNKLLGSASEEILILSAVGIRNLSMATMDLSKPTYTIKKKKRSWFMLCCFGVMRSDERDENKNKAMMCPVHKGVCSSRTFCLVKTGAIERLLGCVEHESDAVVDAALSAVCTLLEGKVDVQQSMRVLGEHDGVKAVLGVLREERGEEVRQKALWVIERFLASGFGGVVGEIERDRVLCSVLLSGLHHKDGDVRVMCENMLMCLKRMPNSSRHASS